MTDKQPSTKDKSNKTQTKLVRYFVKPSFNFHQFTKRNSDSHRFKWSRHACSPIFSLVLSWRPKPCAWIYCVLWALAKQFVYSESDVSLISEESDTSRTDVDSFITQWHTPGINIVYRYIDVLLFISNLLHVCVCVCVCDCAGSFEWVCVCVCCTDILNKNQWCICKSQLQWWEIRAASGKAPRKSKTQKNKKNNRKTQKAYVTAQWVGLLEIDWQLWCRLQRHIIGTCNW